MFPERGPAFSHEMVREWTCFSVLLFSVLPKEHRCARRHGQVGAFWHLYETDAKGHGLEWYLARAIHWDGD
jgi:transposase-like protein